SNSRTRWPRRIRASTTTSASGPSRRCARATRCPCSATRSSSDGGPAMPRRNTPRLGTINPGPRIQPRAMSRFAEDPIDHRRHPERYRIGRGEAGVFRVQPYKSELLPLWSFRTAEAARRSAEALWAKYEAYREAGDFVGMDMARKYLQMGFTRAMRYAQYPEIGRAHV